MQQTALSIEQLLCFGVQHSLIAPLDVYVARNTLLDLFNLSQPWEGEVPQTTFETPTFLLETLLDCAAQSGLFDNEVPALRINFEAKIMGALMPRASEVATRFDLLWRTEGARAATQYFYTLCISSNYIRTAQIAQNIKWDYAGQYGTMEITINLTKPEKDPKTIALERLQPASSYPKCMLCIENIGYAGRINFPARQTHRAVPLLLCDERWYLQYSPYVYYNEHCIIFSETHEPMQISNRTFAQLFDFVRQFPHYTCGSNADLPIVGGSILSHTHFQGGCYEFPMQKATTVQHYTHESYPDITISILRWPVSTVRVTGTDIAQLLAFSDVFLSTWRNYSDAEVDVLAYTEIDGVRAPHNTVTPILFYDETKGYVLDLVPRNNRTSAQYPDGIFHPHQNLHHIKKENIGLIEVMGLAILPSRLKTEGEQIAHILTGHAPISEVSPVHKDWVSHLVKQYGTQLSLKEAHQTVQQEMGRIFEQCLEDAGVFKQTKTGLSAFHRFLAQLGCKL